MSISSSKPQSVGNTLGGGERVYNLVFKPGSQGKRLTQDAVYVCQLLAISPDDLIPWEYDSFAEKGLSEKRQQIRFEHYEEKRHLKLKAIQNVLIQCQSRDITNADSLQVQALIEDLKKQQSVIRDRSQMMSRSPDFAQTSYLNRSTYIDSQTNKQVEKAIEKIEKYQKIKDNVNLRRFESEQKS